MIIPEAAAVAAKLGSPFKLWGVVWVRGRQGRRNPPYAYVSLHTTKANARENLLTIIREHFEACSGINTVSPPEYDLFDAEQKQEYDDERASELERATKLADAACASVDDVEVDDFDSESDYHCAIRELEVAP